LARETAKMVLIIGGFELLGVIL